MTLFVYTTVTLTRNTSFIIIHMGELKQMMLLHSDDTTAQASSPR